MSNPYSTIHSNGNSKAVRCLIARKLGTVVEDSKKHIRQRYALKTDDEILIIPQNPIFAADRRETRKLRVCAYCRVSTPDEAQTSSFEIQRNYYEEYIPKQENWIYSGIYADEGISGTNLKKRDDFNRMIADCKGEKSI